MGHLALKKILHVFCCHGHCKCIFDRHCVFSVAPICIKPRKTSPPTIELVSAVVANALSSGVCSPLHHNVTPAGISLWTRKWNVLPWPSPCPLTMGSWEVKPAGQPIKSKVPVIGLLVLPHSPKDQEKTLVED